MILLSLKLIIMDSIFLHPKNPNKREVRLVAERLSKGDIIIFPTDTIYAVGCLMSNKKGIERIIKLTGKKEKESKLSLICKDIKEVSNYTLPLDNDVFKAMKRYLPGPFTFILNADKSVTKLFKINKKEIGIRIPDNEILTEILRLLDQPLISTSLSVADAEEEFYVEPDDIANSFEHSVDIFIDGGTLKNEGSTIIDCTSGNLEVVRQGIGIID